MNLFRFPMAALIVFAPFASTADEYQAEAALRPRSAIHTDGAYVIVTSDREHIIAKRYNAKGTQLGNAIIVDDGTETIVDDEERPEVKNHSVAMDAAGNFVVAWEAAGESHNVHFRLFDRNGKSLAHRSYSNRLRPGVSMTPNGGFLVTSKDFAASGSIVGEFFDRKGKSASASFPISTGSPMPWASASAVSDDGIVFVAYEERSPSSTGIRAVAIDRKQNDKAEQLYRIDVSKDRVQAAHHPAVASGPNGEVAIVWEEISKESSEPRKNVILAVLDAKGAFIKRPTSITPNPLRFRDTNPKVRFNEKGQVVITYSAHAEEIKP